ncbi:MAG: hypothetical protein OXC82_05110 [Rhodobacteraceae bacterium]|nr:hypothetical protein [Paracoccaceae bacterium]MCY4249801.1 hypothetical protein [Paracoccaceae bacterium]
MCKYGRASNLTVNRDLLSDQDTFTVMTPCSGHLTPWNIAHKISPVFHGVKMTPPAFQMVISRTLAPACGTGQPIAAMVGDMNTQFPFLVDNFQYHNLSGRLNVK